MLVHKKDGSWRLCIEYQTLYKVAIWNRYPIQWIGELLDQLKGDKFFNNIDLNFGYHQVPIEPSDVWNTELKNKEGHFKWLVMLLG